ncbi:MAG: adenylate/guanylate cyclase domain-containing protein [Bacteroidota bacterium]
MNLRPTILFFLLMLAFALRAAAEPPRAENALLDLSGWKWEAGGVVELAGEWQMYWEQLLPPAAISEGARLPSLIELPGNWNAKERNGRPLGPTGYGTFRLRVLLPPGDQILALRIPPIRSAFKLWCNGIAIASSGTVADNSEAYRPSYHPQIVALSETQGRLDLVLQVSNFDHRHGGISFPVSIGPHAEVIQQHNRRNMYGIFLMAAVFVMALYHLGIYLIRKKERSALAFAMYCFFAFLRIPLEGQYIFYQLFPGTDLIFWLKFDYLTFLGVGFGFCYFLSHLFPEEWSRRMTRIIAGVIGLMALVVVAIPVRASLIYVPLIQVIILLGGAYCIYVIVQAARHKQAGSGMMLFAVSVFFIFYVNDVLYYSSSLSTGVLTTSATLLFIFIQAFLLSSRYSNAFSLTEVYARTFQKFVPRQFLDRIAKNGISSIELGNAAPEEAVILFSDIRGFTALSEQMSPNEVFQFLNEYLSRLEPSIRANGGFVDKYLGDAIMALFTDEDDSNSSENALRAAIGMQGALKALNRDRAANGLPPLASGIGLHYGKVIIGTVGGGERMDSTAIGDAVNLASRVEGASKIYQVPVLATDEVVEALPVSHPFRLRFLDRVRVVGREQPVGLWEVRGTSDQSDHAADLARIALFERAVQEYLQGNFLPARQGFEAYLELVPADGPAQLYLQRCEEQSVRALPAGWTGVTDLGSK